MLGVGSREFMVKLDLGLAAMAVGCCSLGFSGKPGVPKGFSSVFLSSEAFDANNTVGVLPSRVDG